MQHNLGHWIYASRNETINTCTNTQEPKAQICPEYRTICFMSHVTKLLLKILQVRIIVKINNEVSELLKQIHIWNGHKRKNFQPQIHM